MSSDSCGRHPAWLVGTAAEAAVAATAAATTRVRALPLAAAAAAATCIATCKPVWWRQLRLGCLCSACVLCNRAGPCSLEVTLAIMAMARRLVRLVSRPETRRLCSLVNIAPLQYCTNFFSMNCQSSIGLLDACCSLSGPGHARALDKSNHEY